MALHEHQSGSADQGQGPPTPKKQWFTTTHWSVVLNAAHDSAPGAKEALEKLCQTY
jgi:hypothetical protein